MTLKKFLTENPQNSMHYVGKLRTPLMIMESLEEDTEKKDILNLEVGIFNFELLRVISRSPIVKLECFRDTLGHEIRISVSLFSDY